MIKRALLIASAMVLSADARHHHTTAMLIDLDNVQVVNLQGLNQLVNLDMDADHREKN